MHAVTIELADDILALLERIAQQRNVGVETLLGDMAVRTVTENDVDERFPRHALRGKGREQERLDLLRR